MSHRRQIDPARAGGVAEVGYMNKFAQIASLVSARKQYIELGRGSAKTTDIQVERLLDVMTDMPGAPAVWVADTFSNLTANILPSVLEGLERKGYKEGVHYVIESEPPSYSDRETAGLPDWLRPHFWKPFNRLVSYKRTMVFYTGFNLRFGSLDRPSTLAGASYVFVFGDEAKYFREDKISNLLKAVRGYRAEYGGSVFYRGVSFTSDVADTTHVGEYGWMSKAAGQMDVGAVLLAMRAGLVYNEAMREWLAAKERWSRTRDPRDLEECRTRLKVASGWRERWVRARRQPGCSVFYMRASSYVNADILTPEWFSDAISGAVPDLNVAILSRRPSLSSGERFYAALSERHFYTDGIDEEAYARFGLRDAEDCRVLRHLDRGCPLRLGVDFGNMCSMVVGQEGTDGGRECIRALKFLYTLAPDYIDELGRMFLDYFAPMRNRLVRLYYDRSGNAYKSVGRDQVTQLKRAIEYGADGRRTGWTVQLMNVGQGNIGQPEEYGFMLAVMRESNPRLPVVRIDAFAAKHLKLSLENARTRVVNGITYKDKSSEKLPVAQLPTRSTNASDAFKYFLMSRELRAAAKAAGGSSAAVIDPSFSG